MKDRKVLKVGSSYMVTLPMDIVRGFGWDENTRIRVRDRTKNVGDNRGLKILVC